MTDSWDAVEMAVHALGDAWREGGGDARRMTDAALLALTDQFAAVRRLLDGAFVPVAAELAARSRPEHGSQGLARRAGHRSPVQLIAATTGGHVGEAARMVQVAEATRPTLSFAGAGATGSAGADESAGEPRHPFVSRALREGTVSVAAAAAITGMLDRVGPRVAAEMKRAAEEGLVGVAAGLSLDAVNALVRRAEAELDPGAVEEKVQQLRSERFLKIAHDRAGMVVVNGRLDPETAAPVVAFVEGYVTHHLRASRGRNAPGGWEVQGAGAEDAGAAVTGEMRAGGMRAGDVAPVASETRTLGQLRADALAEVCRHALAADAGALPRGAAVAVVVRMSLEDLQTGEGLADIDGMDEPIDAGTARRMAAGAAIIPCVLGGEGEVLDWGRAKRHFTRAQRQALVERDGGCAFCHLPPAFTEAHHLRWWKRHRGTTDLSNGILLCSACHHRVHDEGWEIRIEHADGVPPSAGTVWFVPPAHIDPTRAPRLGGRRRFDPATWNLAA